MTNLTESATVDLLAADIREVDGNHSLGAGALAQALAAKGWTKPQIANELARTARPSRPAERMSLKFLIENYRDGDGRGWQGELEWLQEHDPKGLYGLADSIHAEGIREPVLLGDDGRVWDGHHRICAAFLIGMKEVPVIHSKDL